MQKSDFYYDLPKELIAQTPVTPRDASRLMILNKNTGEIKHKRFYEVLDFLNSGDCLILNNSRVLPARIYGTKAGTGAVVEFLLLENKGNDVWEALAGPGKKARTGSEFIFGNGKMKCKVVDVLKNGNRLIQFDYDGIFFNILDEIGEMPLPPYITEKLSDGERYQTVYSKDLGSAAAPTAGLHFTSELLEKVQKKGVKIGFVTLHVGLGTFRPVTVKNIEDHLMHSEHYFMSRDTAELINCTKKSGKKVFAVGTTSCRTIEAVAKKANFADIQESEGFTDIFIYPGYEFVLVDGLITNFHLPESTLMMLVSALSEREYILSAYNKAIEEGYRFFSFGDAMLIL